MFTFRKLTITKLEDTGVKKLLHFIFLPWLAGPQGTLTQQLIHDTLCNMTPLCGCSPYDFLLEQSQQFVTQYF